MSVLLFHLLMLLLMSCPPLNPTGGGTRSPSLWEGLGEGAYTSIFPNRVAPTKPLGSCYGLPDLAKARPVGVKWAEPNGANSVHQPLSSTRFGV